MDAEHVEETEKSTASPIAPNTTESNSQATTEKQVANPTTSNNGESRLYEAPYSFAKDMLPYSGYVNHVSLVNTMFRPFVMLASPAVLWATLLFTTCISWLVGISVTLSQIFSAPPYNFSVTAVGLTNLSSFVASILATLIAGPLIDGVVRRMSMRNGGTFGKSQSAISVAEIIANSATEPEFRLPIMVSYLIFTATGFFAWGEAAQAQTPWEVPVIVCLGLINFGVQLGTTGVVAYVVDCHRDKAGEAFATMNFVKNCFAFGLTFYINDWIAVQGVRNAFFVIGGLTVAASLCTIPMYIYGKRARSWTHRHNIAGKA